MNFSPALEEVRKYAEDGKYRVLPVSCELLSDAYTPIEVLRKLKQVSTHTYLLESVSEHGMSGRYTFLGYEPKLEITAIDGQMKIGDVTVETAHPDVQLRQILKEYSSPKLPNLPPFTASVPL